MRIIVTYKNDASSPYFPEVDESFTNPKVILGQAWSLQIPRAKANLFVGINYTVDLGNATFISYNSAYMTLSIKEDALGQELGSYQITVVAQTESYGKKKSLPLVINLEVIEDPDKVYLPYFDVFDQSVLFQTFKIG